MTKQKAGIFDPWRQTHEPAITPQTVDKSDTTGNPDPAPVRFAGRRAGVIVWLPGGDPAQAQANVLFALESLMADKALYSFFTARGVLGGKEHVEGASLRTIMSDGSRTVVVLGDYQTAMDSIAFAFREVSRAKSQTVEYLTSLGIRPYIV